MEKRVLKVPGGKLVKVFMQKDGGRIAEVSITGDFFMHPEESISELESSLKGLELETNCLAPVLEGFFDREDVQAFGVDANAMAQALLMFREGQ